MPTRILPGRGCGWETDFSVPIYAGMETGVYGVRLRAGAAEDIIPFYVLPPRGTVTAPIAFLASTFTYQIYGNHDRGNSVNSAASPGCAARTGSRGDSPLSPKRIPP